MAKYIKNNQESTAMAYYKRIIFNSKVVAQQNEFSNLVNFRHGEHLLFGRVNQFFVPMMVRKPDEKIVTLPQKLCATQQPIRVLNFVSEMFQGVVRSFEKAAMQQKINTNDPYLSSIKAYKAYMDPERQYREYFKTFSTALKDNFDKNKIVVREFDGFMRDTFMLLSQGVRTYPFTHPAYMKSKLCSMNTSGLVIEIADLKYEDDEEKINMFVNSPNWAFFVNTCSTYGFRVDVDAPWRLVADIGAPEVRQRASQYVGGRALNNTGDLLNAYYRPVHSRYFQRFPAEMYNLYNTIRYETYAVGIECDDSDWKVERKGKVWTLSDGETAPPRRHKIVESKVYTREEFVEEFSIDYFLDYYLKIRLLEDESQLSQAHQDQLIKQCRSRFKSSGLSSALQGFERIVNKTFDYRGSFSYIKEQDKHNVELVPTDRSILQNLNNDKD